MRFTSHRLGAIPDAAGPYRDIRANTEQTSSPPCLPSAGLSAPKDDNSAQLLESVCTCSRARRRGSDPMPLLPLPPPITDPNKIARLDIRRHQPWVEYSTHGEHAT
jgi:hypothetical protein